MYSTCLFCHGHLGRNECLEHFPVGRRLAYDAFTGRLWVICRRCQRWNLSPLETRWEAIEEAERAFSRTRLRVSTDNIALAQVREGLELVRIGKPPKLEMAGWRYGNPFARRWMKHAALAGVGVTTATVYGVASLGPLLALGIPQQLAIVAPGAYALYQAGVVARHVRDKRQIAFHVRNDDGSTFGLTRNNVKEACLVPEAATGGWRLQFPYREWDGQRYDEERTGAGLLYSDTALRALTVLLPYLNRSGGREQHVRDAVHELDATASVAQLILGAARNRDAWKSGYSVPFGRSNLGALPPRTRLAMEMVLHEDSERHALEHELAQLHNRWKEAEEIGRIADGLL